MTLPHLRICLTFLRYIQLGNGTRTLISNTDSSSSELVQKNFVDPFDTREKSLVGIFLYQTLHRGI